MLRKLSIQNYAIIEELELSFSDKLTVITGETGAGKSIVMEALSLVLGERADTNVLFDKAKKCVVEAEFDIHELDLKTFFEENDLDAEDVLTLRREISSAGKSRAFINDTPVNLPVMKLLGDHLVDMHQQHESQEISTSQFQLALLDSLSSQERPVKDFRNQFQKYQQNVLRWQQLNDEHERETQELDYLNFQLNELSNADLKFGEQYMLEQEQQQLQHAEEILRVFAMAYNQLKESEDALMQRLGALLHSMNSVKRFLPESEEVFQRAESARIELDDIASEIESLQQTIAADPERLQEIQQRLDLIFRLQKKHKVNDVASLMMLAQDLRKKINSISMHTEELEELGEKNSEQKNKLIKAAEKISSSRKKQVPKVIQSINTMLKDVGMPHAQIKIEHETLKEDELNANGLDRFQFLFAPNKGSSFGEIKKIASGGELSRLMLCFKSLIASSTSLPTLIFDEIDSGISGETAMKVSRILKKLADEHQVICITHLPQLAAKGDTHYFVYKEISRGKTYTHVRALNKEEKIKTIAQMIGGEKTTAAALESAKELLN
ncbi:MAG TPA: DNA repair protein RecN [Chitinophagales bacterium]|nr:DNA repair protein RecN [Chitinophagales bacterium]